MATKARLWYVTWTGVELLVCDKQRFGGLYTWKVRAISWRAAGRKLIRGGTVRMKVLFGELEYDGYSSPKYSQRCDQNIKYYLSKPGFVKGIDRLTKRRLRGGIMRIH